MSASLEEAYRGLEKLDQLDSVLDSLSPAIERLVFGDFVHGERPSTQIRLENIGELDLVFSEGPKTDGERTLFSAAIALWAKRHLERKSGAAFAAKLLRLASRTGANPFSLLETHCSPETSDRFREALSEIVKDADGARFPTDILLAQKLLGAESGLLAKDTGDKALDEQTEPIQPATSDATVGKTLTGEIVSSPRAKWLTLVLLCTGILFIVALFQLILRVVFMYKRPAQLRVEPGRIRVVCQTMLLGRTLREQSFQFERGSVSRAVREVRFGNAPFYVGVAFLAVGTFLGARIFIDGIRAASPLLLLVGILFVAGAVILDYLFTYYFPTTGGRSRVSIYPYDAKSLSIGFLGRNEADQVLTYLLERPTPSFP